MTFKIEDMYRTVIGMDSLLDQFRGYPLNKPAVTNFPYYNIVKNTDTSYHVEIALAGYSPEEIDISVEKNILTVKSLNSSKRAKNQGANYIFKGFTSKEFTRAFTLESNVEVRGAKFNNGVLIIDLERNIPQEELPRKIKITG